MTRLTSFVLLCATAVLLLGCSQTADNGPLQLGTPAADLPLSQLPPMPAEHSASVLIGYYQEGYNTFGREPSAVDEGTSLRLLSSTGAMSWGVWGFGSASGATSCLIDFSTEDDSEAYFAVANFAKGAWDVGGPLPGPQQEILLDSPDYVSEAGDVFIAVISYGGDNLLVEQLLLNVDVSPVQKTIDFSGGFTSLAMVNGQPAISYYDDADDNLRYVRATDLFGSDWGEPETPDSSGDTGKHTSLDIVDGFPAIAYYDVSTKNLRYVRALDVDGADWGEPLTVDGLLTETGEYCSLEVVDGQPAISYYNVDGPSLRYVRALDSTGLLWGLPVDVDDEGNTGTYSSLKVVDGFPAIGYRNGALAQLRYVRALDDTGLAWDDPLPLDAESNGGFSANLLVVNGAPAICHYDGSDSRLRYIRATDATGGEWGDAQTLDGVDDDAGDYCSMAIIGGFPAISYYNGLQGDLRYVEALDADGANWGDGVILDETSNIVGRDTSLIDVYGYPAVSYFDQTNAGLRYMWGF